MRQWLVFLFLHLLWSPLAFPRDEGSSAITVSVKDPQGAGVAGARVRVYTRDGRLRLVARTDAGGVYRFADLSPGLYLVDAEAPGFTRARPMALRLEPQRDRELELSLQIAAHREEVVVTASSTVQTVDEVSKAVTAVEAAEMEERDELSVAEALRAVPGLWVQRRGGPGAFTSIKTRGLRNEDTAVLIDGVRLRDAAAPQGDATAFLEDLIITNADRVEVLRGSGSSLYGTNAIGGVIHIITRDGGGRARGNLLSEGGSLGLFRARAHASGGRDGDRLTYSAGLSYLNVSSGVDGDDAARNTSGQARLRYRISADTSVSARLYVSGGSVMLNENPQAVGSLSAGGVVDGVALAPDELERYASGTPLSELDLGGASFIPSANDPDARQDSRFVSGLVGFEQRPGEGWGYTLRYHGLATARTLLDGPRGVSPFEPDGLSSSDFDGRIHTLHAVVDAEWGPHQLVTAGYELESERFEARSESAGTVSEVGVTQRSNAFFLQDQLRFLDGALQLSGAFRTQLFSLGRPRFVPAEGSPFGGLEFQAPDNAYTADGSLAYFHGDSGSKLRAHVGNGYRAPSLFERFGASFGPFGYSVFGDPRLGPESSIGVDAGWDQDLASGRARVSMTWFYTRLKKVIFFDFSGAIDSSTDPFGRFAGYRRTDGGRARGLEVGFTAASVGRLRLGASYTYTDAEPPSGTREDLDQAYGIPRHQFSLVATQAVTRDLYVNFDLTLSGSYLAPLFDPVSFAARTYRFDGIAKADLVASYTWRVLGRGGLRFFVKVENLLDQSYYENGFPTPGRMGRVGAAFQF